MRSGTKLLRIGSLLQILFGAGYFLLARFLLGEGDVDLGGMSGEEALMTVLISYGGCAFQVLAGLVGLALANRRSLLTVIFGVLLYIPVLARFLQADGDIVTIVITAVTLVSPTSTSTARGGTTRPEMPTRPRRKTGLFAYLLAYFTSVW